MITGTSIIIDGVDSEVPIYISTFIFNYQYLSAVEFKGKFEQGSFILGKTKPKSKVKIDNKKIRVSKDGFFAFGLDRDRKNNVIIIINEEGKIKTIEKQVLKKNIKFKE